MRRHRALVSLLSLGIAFVSGCGGSGGSGGGTGGNSGGTGTTQTNDYALSSQAVELDKAQSLGVSSVTDDSVLLQNAPLLTAGQVLVHNGDGASDEGFVRKVVSATVSGSTTTVQTAPATIADAFTTASIDQDNDFSQDELNKVQPADDSISISPNVGALAKFARRAGKSRGTDGGAIDITFANTSIKNANGAEIATLDGTITVAGGVTGQLQIANGTLSSFQVAPYLNVYGNLHLTTKVAGVIAADVPVTQTATIPTPNIFGPFNASTKLQYRVKIDGSGPVGTEIQVSATVQGKAGFSYTLTGGLEKTTDLKKTISMTAPKTDTAEYELAASLARPQFDVSVTGLGTASATADVLRTVATSKATTTPATGFNSQAFGEFGATARAKVSVPILGQIQTIDTGSVTASLPRFPISDVIFYAGSTPPPASDTTICFIGPGGHTVQFCDPDGTNVRTIYDAGTGYPGWPHISPYGRKVAFTVYNPVGGTNKLFVTDQDGANPHETTANGEDIHYASWSPGSGAANNASESLILAYRYNNYDQVARLLFLTGQIDILTSSSMDHSNPVMAPDGNLIYYSTYLFGKQGVGAVGYFSPEQTVFASTTDDYSQPAISPDGTLALAKTSGKGITIADIGPNPNPRLLIADPNVSEPNFSPDGTRIIALEEVGGVQKIVTFDLNGGDRKEITLGAAPTWGRNTTTRS